MSSLKIPGKSYALKQISSCVYFSKAITKKFLGCFGLHHVNSRAIEIGLWLKESIHGKGYGTETVQALTNWASRYLDFDYLYYPVDKENVASRKSLKNLIYCSKSYVKRKSDTENLQIIEYRKNKIGL